MLRTLIQMVNNVQEQIGKISREIEALKSRKYRKKKKKTSKKLQKK